MVKKVMLVVLSVVLVSCSSINTPKKQIEGFKEIVPLASPIIGGRYVRDKNECVVCFRAYDDMKTATVDDVVDAMRQSGFGQIRGVPTMGERIKFIDKEIEHEGKTYKFKAMYYDDGAFYFPRYVAREINANRLEELKLILAGKIPHTVYGGGWLPKRIDGPCEGLDYKKSKVEVVATLPDGRIIKHVTPVDDCVPYFSVETIKRVKRPVIFSQELNPTDRFGRTEKYYIPTPQEIEKKLKSTGEIAEDVKVIQVYAVDGIVTRDIVAPATVVTRQDIEVNIVTAEVYPYISE